MPEVKPSKPAVVDDDEGPDASLRKLTSSFGVTAYAILNRSGIPIKAHNMDNADALHYAALLSELTLATQLFLSSSAQLLPSSTFSSSPQSSELQSLRLKSRKHEIIVTADDNYTLIVLHNAKLTAGGAPAAVDVVPAEAAAAGDKKKDKAPAHEEKESD